MVFKGSAVRAGGLCSNIDHITQARALLSEGPEDHDRPIWVRNAPEPFFDQDREEREFAVHLAGWQGDGIQAQIDELKEAIRELKKEHAKTKGDDPKGYEMPLLESSLQGLKLEQARNILGGPEVRELSHLERTVVAARTTFYLFQRDEEGRRRRPDGRKMNERSTPGCNGPERGKGGTNQGTKKGKPQGWIYGYKFEIAVHDGMTNAEIRRAVDKLLDQVAPSNFAVCTIHDDTGQRHAHVLVFARGADGKKLRFPKKLTDKERARLLSEGKVVPIRFTELDERWMRIYADHLGDEKVFTDYIRKKYETLEWKRGVAIAIAEGRPIPLKPDRVADHRDQIAERRASKRATRSKTLGRETSPRGPAERIPYRANIREAGRQMAVHRVAEARLEMLKLTGAPHEDLLAAERECEKISAVLGETLRLRKERGLAEPLEVMTVNEKAQLDECRQRIGKVKWEKDGERVLEVLVQKANDYLSKIPANEQVDAVHDQSLRDHHAERVASIWGRTMVDEGILFDQKGAEQALMAPAVSWVEKETRISMHTLWAVRGPDESPHAVAVDQPKKTEARPPMENIQTIEPAQPRSNPELERRLARALGEEYLARVNYSYVCERIAGNAPWTDEVADRQLKNAMARAEKLVQEYKGQTKNPLPDPVITEEESKRVGRQLKLLESIGTHADLLPQHEDVRVVVMDWGERAFVR